LQEAEVTVGNCWRGWRWRCRRDAARFLLCINQQLSFGLYRYTQLTPNISLLLIA